MVGEIATQPRPIRVPTSLADIVPIPASRSAQSILEGLRESGNAFARRVHRIHSSFGAQPHRAIAKQVIRLLNAEPMLITGVAGSDWPIRVDGETKAAIILYLRAQERPDITVIERTNAMLARRPEIIETILGLQMALCEALADMLAEAPELFGSSIAFGEFARIEAGVVKPSKRFAKIVIDNIGEAASRADIADPLELLDWSIREAGKNGLFRQQIALFQPAGKEFTLLKIQERACPAQGALAEMIRTLATTNKEKFQ